MKKLLSVSIATLALAAVADYSITVGITAITTTELNTVIPAPFTSLEGGNTIPVSQLVKAANLPDDTMLYYYNGTSFEAWKRGTGDWQTTDIASTKKDGITVSPGADTVVLGPGNAIWLVLPSAPAAEGQKIYVYGKPVSGYAEDSTTTTVAAGKTTLIGNPRVKNAKDTSGTEADLTIEGANTGDTISIIDSEEGSLTTYKYNGEEWGYYEEPEAGVSGLPVWTSAGNLRIGAWQGVWYKSLGSSSVTLTWTDVEKER